MQYLEARNIVKQYGSHTALRDVSVSVPRGCIYGFLGPNGAGKSSLIRIINRITMPDSGAVFMNGTEIGAQDVCNIGYLPEERGLYKKMKVGEHVVFLARLRGLSKADAKAKAQYWLKRLDIIAWEHKKVEELSKGMQQKIQFIATVIHSPRLLILDEPFSGFDPVNAELLTNELSELKANGVTIILSTHNMESVEALCDEISLINKSQVVLQGDVRDIRHRFRKHEFKVQLAASEFDLGPDNFDLLAHNQVGDVLTIRIKRKKDTPNSALIAQIAAKYEILSLEELLPSMNDIFIQTVSQ